MASISDVFTRQTIALGLYTEDFEYFVIFLHFYMDFEIKSWVK